MRAGYTVFKSDQRYPLISRVTGVRLVLDVADKYLQLLDRQYYNSYGKVVKVVGLTIESVGPKARLGDLCKIYPDEDRTQHVIAEVVGFQDSRLILMPVDSVEGVGVGCIVENTGHPTPTPSTLSTGIRISWESWNPTTSAIT